MPELAAFRVTDRDAWNTFIEHAPYRSFPQLWEWGELRETSGWRPIRVAVGEDADHPRAGAQVLMRQVPLVGWRLVVRNMFGPTSLSSCQLKIYVGCANVQ